MRASTSIVRFSGSLVLSLSYLRNTDTISIDLSYTTLVIARQDQSHTKIYP
jgi:hypothetical protein